MGIPTIKAITKATIAIVRSAEIITGMAKIDQSAPLKGKQAVKALTDAISFLGHAQENITIQRKEGQRPAVPFEAQGICDMPSDGHDWLYGDDVEKKMREAREQKKLTSSCAPRHTNKRGHFLGASRANHTSSFYAKNRNSLMAYALLSFIKKYPHIRKITQKYSETGHSMIQEVDSAHSSIERHLRNVEVYSPISLIRQLFEVRRTPKLKILQMRHVDVSPTLYFDNIDKCLPIKHDIVVLLCYSNSVLTAQAELIASELGNTEFKATVGWIEQFKGRHGIAHRSVSGEAAAVDQTIVNDWRQSDLPRVLQEYWYKEEDIFNADEIFFTSACLTSLWPLKVKGVLVARKPKRG
ncbi:tigger transposable element-derived protein 6 [Plakobranchus ocellatus]|uniref:Tigger transposable element-derived protein 6 n=1 Tax=Plakobranchus ocellatus TaxID=259542 RepID=A0AAV4BFW6_9GAST|nr:tigger transposable element-derived protein 6 [Plakobranchus ocellatus]